MNLGSPIPQHQKVVPMMNMARIFWLNACGKYPNVTKEMFSCNGYQGHYVFIIPSKDLVIVRFGLAENPEFDVDTFLKEVLSAIKKTS